MAELSFEQSKAYLQAKGGDAVMGSVYEHFTKIIAKVIQDRPDDPQAAFEILSRFLRTEAGKSGEAEPMVPLEKLMERANYGEKASGLLKMPGEDAEGGGGGCECAVPNFMEEAEMFVWAGVGFGEGASYQIMMSLRKLATLEDPKPRKLRLWGKICGSQKDYLVAEGQMDGQGEPDANDPDFEPQGTGANKYTYWVTSDPCEDWVKLPEVKPAHLKAARLTKRMLTGDLDARVVSHPWFPGDERDLLRAQIARITSDTVLCVKGYLQTSDEDPDTIEENAEFVFPLAEVLATKEGWTHCVEHILRIGRTTYQEPAAEGEDAEAELKELARKKEEDPPRSMIRKVADDKELAWSIRQFGDMTSYKTGASIKSNRVTAVRSLTWPGAVCVAKGGGGFANIYVGYGMKAGEPDFFPQSPPDIMDEPVDPGDQPEPQGEVPVQEEPAEGEEGG